MDYIVEPGKISGEIAVYGAKNCALALLGASVLTPNEIVLKNCPCIEDVNNMLKILKLMGKNVHIEGNKVSISGHLSTTSVPKELAKLLRGSSLLLGSTLARYGNIKLPLPGGCAIGARPLDIHLDGLRKLGVVVCQQGNTLNCFGIPKGNVYTLRSKSVGATENLLCACALAKGHSTLINCATEPEVVALEKMLSSMGARIDGIGTSILQVCGVDSLSGTQFTVIPDRIVAATYLSCALASDGELFVDNCNPTHLYEFLKIIKNSCKLNVYENSIRVANSSLKICGEIITGPYPAFATDIQPLVLSLSVLSKNSITIVQENMFESRLEKQCEELSKMGAEIVVHNNKAMVVGGNLCGATVRALDLRGGAGLVVASLGAKGPSRICGIENISRGYCD